METMENRILKVTAEYAGMGIQHITPETRLLDDLGFDSLDEIELAMAIEGEFEIELPDDEIENIETVQGIFDVVRKHIANQGE